MSAENSELDNEVVKHSSKGKIIRYISLICYIIFLYFFYNLLIINGASIGVAILTILFLFLVFLGVLLKKKKIKQKPELESNYEEEKSKFLKKFEKYHPQSRRIDYINLKGKYRKPIVRKCSKCGITLAGFVKKCPNCGEKIFE